MPDAGRAASVGLLLAWAGDGHAAAAAPTRVPGALQRAVAAVGRWRAGDPDAAVADLRRFALEADCVPLWLLGELELERGRPREAAEALEAYLRFGGGLDRPRASGPPGPGANRPG